MAGVPALFSPTTPGEVECVDHLVGGATRTEATPAIRVDFSADPIALPSTEPDETVIDIRLWYGDDGTVIADHSTGLTCRVDGSRALFGGRPTPELLWKGFRQLCVPALTALLSAHGVAVIHAAAVERDGRAVAVLGPTGGGKSTIAALALSRRWRALSDDLVAVQRSPTGDGLEIQGIPRRMAVLGELVPNELRSASEPVPHDPRQRWMLPHGQLASGWHRLAAAIVSTNSPTTSGLQPLGEDGIGWVLWSFALSGSRTHLKRVFPLLVAMGRLNRHMVSHPGGTASESAVLLASMEEAVASVRQ